MHKEGVSVNTPGPGPYFVLGVPAAFVHKVFRAVDHLPASDSVVLLQSVHPIQAAPAR